ncbi:MAG: AIR synthase-related protein [Nanoarchaeota archaeon]
MPTRFEVVSNTNDARANVILDKLHSSGFSQVKGVSLADVYTVDVEDNVQGLDNFRKTLFNPVSQRAGVNGSGAPEGFDYAVDIGGLPGVTDNVGRTAREGLEHVLGESVPGQGVFTSRTFYLTGKELNEESAKSIGLTLSNPVIQRVHVKSADDFKRDGGMDLIVPRVNLTERPRADVVDLIGANSEELVRIGKQGIANADGSRRGPLAMDLTYMKAVQDYSRKIGRNLRDIELEAVAQSWSEHCEHTIFNDPIDDIKEGLFKRFIRGATEEIIDMKSARGEKTDCVSLFSDNSGAFVFDDKWLITDKKETHNSPSALDPFGGAITGLVGVFRDALGFGMGAKPVAGGYGFCLGNSLDDRILFRDANKQQPLLSPRRIMDGVIEGVNAGGNQSGVPTPQGYVYFDDDFRGKPLVFVRTIGLIPRRIEGEKSWEKKANDGNYIVVIGGRVGLDGIHGATFSSESLSSGSPATAVQIGDPITQRKLWDAMLEARDKRLYSSVTDNGAGGLSCSVNEMASESGGCVVYLDKVPTKYPGMQPWQILVSESQERMTLSVPKENWNEFSSLMQRRDVEASVIGEFTDNGKSIVQYGGETICDLDLDFLHNGRPARPMTSKFERKINEEPNFAVPNNLNVTLEQMLARPNVASFEFISRQFDHEVQDGSVVKPLQGKGRVNGDASVFRPVLDSEKGVAVSQAIHPNYSRIDTYHMASCSLDSAVGNLVAVGANPKDIKLMDNFCWSSSNDPQRLGELKRACQALYQGAVAYETPFISGKDSMFNDFNGFGSDGNPIKISAPPTVDISSIAVIPDSKKAVTLDAKFSGDLVYVIGDTYNELGGSEYFAMVGEQERGQKYIGNNVPSVDLSNNARVYSALHSAMDQELVASSIYLGRGGLGVGLAKTAIAGGLGMDVDISDLPGKNLRPDYALFSQSQGRFVVTVNPNNRENFERAMAGTSYAQIGKITDCTRELSISLGGRKIVDTPVENLTKSYKSTFRGY